VYTAYLEPTQLAELFPAFTGMCTKRQFWTAVQSLQNNILKDFFYHLDLTWIRLYTMTQAGNTMAGHIDILTSWLSYQILW